MNESNECPGGKVPAEDRERFARYAEARAFYGGEQWLGRRKRGEPRLTMNYARALLRKVASYVFPAPVTFTIQPQAASSKPQADGDETANRAERALAEAIAAEDLA